jgi:glycosyltransferase involved in cell wall biosynthesis
MQTICIITHAHLCRNPRVLKEAKTLWESGYNVIILTNIYSKLLLSEDRRLIEETGIEIEVVTDLSKNTFSSIIARIIKKVATKLVKHFNMNIAHALGYSIGNYLSACKNINADLFICHQELPSYIGYRLLKKGYKVAFDFEDWYSEDLLPAARKERPIKLLSKVEKFALNYGVFSVTTSDCLARQLAHTYHSSQLPETIYNVFHLREDLLSINKVYDGTIKLFWFSQTIGPGRGLEQFIDNMNKLKYPLQLHLLGNIDQEYKKLLTESVASFHNIYFHSLVQSELLPDKIAQFDIGLALEERTPPSRNFTVTNKFFQYIQSGIPVIASATEGQKEVFSSYEPGVLLESNWSEKQLIEWLCNRNLLIEARSRAVAAAYDYCWDKEKTKLIRLVKKAVKSNDQKSEICRFD